MAEEEKGFVVRDRRRFNADGSAREEEEIAQPEEVQAAAPEVDLSQAEPAQTGAPHVETPGPSEPEAPSPEPEQPREGQAARELSQETQDQAAEAYRHEASQGEASPESQARALPPVEFSGLILSLSHAAMMHLGQVPDPNTGQARQDLELARHTIDTIAMLKEKTQGNLDTEEQRLIDHALTELRMAYVQLSRQSR